MLEILKLKVVNTALSWAEKSGKESLLFVPHDREIREISEAMYLDGSLPSEVNKVTIDLIKEKRKTARTEHRAALDKEAGQLGEALTLDGADKAEIEAVIVDMRKERGGFKRSPVLASYQPVRRVPLA